MINFFNSKICINICIYRIDKVAITNSNNNLYTGSREDCMRRIRDIVNNIMGSEKKIFVFSFSNVIDKEIQTRDCDFEMLRTYFKNQLLLLNTSCKSEIIVNTCLNIIS